MKRVRCFKFEKVRQWDTSSESILNWNYSTISDTFIINTINKLITNLQKQGYKITLISYKKDLFYYILKIKCNKEVYNIFCSTFIEKINSRIKIIKM